MTGFGASIERPSTPHGVTARSSARRWLPASRSPRRAAGALQLRHHAIAAMPIPPRDKRSLYKTLAFERKLAERRLRATVNRWRTVRVDTHPGWWKQFLAERAARGDQRALRRLRQPFRGPAIKSRGTRLERCHRTTGGRVAALWFTTLEVGHACESRRRDRAPRRSQRSCARAVGQGRQTTVRNEKHYAARAEESPRAPDEDSRRARFGDRAGT